MRSDPIAGPLGDMFGKKRMLLVALASLGAGTLVAALTTTLPVMPERGQCGHDGPPGEGS